MHGFASFGAEAIDLITEARYSHAARIAEAVIGQDSDPAKSSSYAIDRIVLNPWLAYPIFFGVIWVMFKITFTLSEPIAEWFVALFDMFGSIVRAC